MGVPGMRSGWLQYTRADGAPPPPPLSLEMCFYFAEDLLQASKQPRVLRTPIDVVLTATASTQGSRASDFLVLQPKK